MKKKNISHKNLFKKILFCGYRSWATEAIDYMKAFGMGGLSVREIKRGYSILHAENVKEFNNVLENHPDIELIFLVGWSWIVPNNVCDRYDIFAFHPSDLPSYAGGSPLQHQILDGIVESKMSLFRVTPKLDAGDVYMKHDLYLEGSMDQIFQRMSHVVVEMCANFITAWPAVTALPRQTPKLALKRLKPEHSELTREMLSNLTARQLYDFIRCKGDPYPNASITDSTGTLLFKDVEFKK